MSKLTFHIKGYGKVVVKFPKKYNKKSFRKGVIIAVVNTLNVTRVEKKQIFHMGLGFEDHG